MELRASIENRASIQAESFQLFFPARVFKTVCEFFLFCFCFFSFSLRRPKRQKNTEEEPAVVKWKRVIYKCTVCGWL